jgi:hypothetical protein
MNFEPRSLRESVKSLDAGEVLHFLTLRGWRASASRRNDVSILRKDSKFEIVLPLSETYADYEDRLKQAVQVAAEAENVPVKQVIQSILTPSSDVLRFRMDDQDIEGGSIPLLEGMNLFDGIRRGLAAVACSVVNPQTFHPRLHRTETDVFLKRCKLGQTEQGSFVAQVLCPIDPLPFEDAHGSFKKNETFGRRVTTGYLKALATLVTAIDEDQVDNLSHADSFVSANLCEALSEMQPSGQKSSLSVDAVWSASIEAPTQIRPIVKIKKRHFETIERVGLILRKPTREASKQVFAGYVEQLKGEPNRSGKMAGETILSILSSEDEWLRVRVVLSPEDYAEACDAHKDSLVVVIRGLLKRGARLSEIIEYDYFSVPKVGAESS